MPTLIIVAAIGLTAQLIDGGLGMGYGVVSSSLLLVAGLSPAAASASVHLAEIGTTLASGFSHWRFGNVDWRIVVRIALPGAIGAFTGATLLASLPADAAKPWTSGLLLALGIFLLVRFIRQRAINLSHNPPRRRFLIPLGLVAGTVDATGGGGWGPITTPALLATGKHEPRTIVGSMSAAEFAVSVAASLGFLFGLANSGIVWPLVAALLIGGVIAAPVAAWLVRKLPTHILGVSVGGVIIATNANTLLETFHATPSVYATTFALIAIAWAAALTLTVRAKNATATATAESQATV